MQKKRELLTIIKNFYKYLKDQRAAANEFVYLSKIRENVVSSPSDRNILRIIQYIQDREYIYIKEIGRNILLKISMHEREPKRRYVQANDVIGYIREKHNQLKEAKLDPKDALKKIKEYDSFVERIIDKIIDMRDNAEKIEEE